MTEGTDRHQWTDEYTRDAETADDKDADDEDIGVRRIRAKRSFRETMRVNNRMRILIIKSKKIKMIKVR